jgi:hypothetical protein
MSSVVKSILVTLCLTAALPSPAVAQDASREDAIKAAYLYNFGRYVDWPSTSFTADNSPLVIGIVGPSVIDQHLAAYTREDKQVRGRPIQIARSIDAKKMAGCHILLLSAQLDARQREEIVKATSGKPILLVSEGADSVLSAGGIHFTVQQNKMKIQIAAAQVRARGLKISSKLLQVAEVVD